MGLRKREKPKSRKTEIEEEDSPPTTPLVFQASSDDDKEACEDLSLKIVEKAMLRKHSKNNKMTQNGVVVASSSRKDELVEAVDRYGVVLDETVGVGGSDSERKKKSKSNKKKKVKKEEVEAEDQSVVIAEKLETVETIKDAEKDVLAEAGTVQMGDNIVLRKLLRGPRYFDPPDSGWGTCYNCGEEGHAAVNCTAAKRKKPCYVCGSLEHNVKQCTMGRDCFICKKAGHRAKDCPEKHQIVSKSLKICLKCGDSGHEMFSCKNDYSLDDLKEMQCYVCKKFGHLCCVSTTDSTPRVISCYQCGQLGHIGLACSRLRAETTDAATPSSCYRCGEEGHFARECSSSVKVGKRRRELSNTKTPRFQKEKEKENDYMGYRSAPHDMDKAKKKKKPLTDERGTTTPQKSKHRGGWMTEHPAEFSPSKSNWSRWRSPATPSTKSTKSSKIHSFSSESHSPRSKSSKMKRAHDGTPDSRGSSKAFHHPRFSASRFGNPGGEGWGRSHSWW